jgi:hypothetical protein
MNPDDELDPKLARLFAVLETVPERVPEHAKAGRAAFLQQAQETAKAVTPFEIGRHNGWMQTIQSKFLTWRKEQSPMFSTLATIILIASIILGGGGASVAAAQSSQPDQPLYGVKVLSEDVQLGLSSDPQSEYQLALEFANRRAEEILTMLHAGSIPPAAVQARYQNQIEQAIQYALKLNDSQAIQALEKIQARLQTQQQAFLQVQVKGSPQAEAALTQSRQMLQDRLQWVELGLNAPAKLRDQLRLHDQQRKQDPMNTTAPGLQATQSSPGAGGGNPWTTGTPTPGSGYGPGMGTGDCQNCTPAAGNGQGSNPWTTGTPTPGSGYGPGMGTGGCQNCTPTAGSGQGSNPWTTGTPTPGSGYGPGPGATGTCTPGAGNGPQPTQPQMNQPTQAGPNLPAGPGGRH